MPARFRPLDAAAALALGLLAPAQAMAVDTTRPPADSIAKGGTPSAPSILPAIADVSALRAWGYIGDGASHPLSGVARFNGASTGGWTLQQWQQVLPAADALTNEMDWAALQSMIDAATGPIAVRFPSNAPRARLDRPLAVCHVSVAFFGAGNGTDSPVPSATANPAPAGTELVFAGGVDGIRHCAGTSAAKVEVHDLTLTSLVTNGTNAGIRDQRANYTYLTNVTINGFNGYCGYFKNPAGTLLSKTRCIGQQAPGTAGIGTGLYFEGSNSFVNHINDTLVQNYATGYRWHSTNDITKGQLGIEDTQVVDSACGGVRSCIVIDSVSANYGPFNYAFLNMSVDATNSFMAMPSANDVLVVGGNWNLDAPVGTWGHPASDPPGNLFDFGTGTNPAHMLRIRDINYVAANANGTTLKPVSLLTVEAAGSDVQLSGWHVDTYPTAPTLAWFALARGARQVVERDTGWNAAYAPTPPPAKAVFFGGAEPSNRMESVGLGVPILSGCGTNPSLAAGSNNTEGTIIEGSGRPTGCTLGFAQPLRSVAPDVMLFNTQGAYPLTMTASGISGFAFTHAAGSMTVHYRARPH